MKPFDSNRDFGIRPIGVVYSPFAQASGVPIQTVYARGVEGRVEVFPEYKDGLRDLAGFERAWLIYIFDRSPGARLKVIPFRDTVERGIFATRAPCRPNPIGLSCVRVLSIEGASVSIADVDVLNGTPLLDIKPYAPDFDSFPESRAGWLEEWKTDRSVADDRFAR